MVNKYVMTDNLKTILPPINHLIEKKAENVDWNENDPSAKGYIKNKPFGEIFGDTLTWNGSTDGLTVINNFALISNEAFTTDDLTNELTIENSGYTSSYPASGFNTVINGVIVSTDFSIVSVTEEGAGVDANGITFPSAGIYVSLELTGSTTITIPGFGKFPDVKKIESKYLPDDVCSYRRAITTEGSGDTYDVTVEGVTSLETGINFTIIPHTTSTRVNAMLNVNNLGPKTIRQRLSTNTSATAAGHIDNWLVSGKPVTVTYNGTYWVADLVRPDANTIYGTVPVANGGVPRATADENGKILSVVDGSAAWVEHTQPDWNQNDETASDYIKNRPFYTGDPSERVIIPETTDIAPSLQFPVLQNAQYTYDFFDGQEVLVIYDGVTYNTIAYVHPQGNGMVVVGNCSALGVDSMGHTEPFGMVNGMFMVYDTAEHTVYASVIDSTIVKLPSEYLPATAEFVNFSLNDDGTYCGDKTSKEIVNCVANGTMVYAKFTHPVVASQTCIIPLCVVSASSCYFSGKVYANDYVEEYSLHGNITSAMTLTKNTMQNMRFESPSGIIVKSITTGSSKYFSIRVDDSGNITAQEVT